MSALAEALVAAQRRALTAMEKAYVAGKMPSNKVPIADGASIHLSRELTSFQLSVGSWYVELRDGKLIVRSRDMSAPELLVLPVEVKG